jgi:hypothetical protein
MAQEVIFYLGKRHDVATRHNPSRLEDDVAGRSIVEAVEEDLA